MLRRGLCWKRIYRIGQVQQHSRRVCPHVLPVGDSRQYGAPKQQVPAVWVQAPSGALGHADSVCQTLSGGVPKADVSSEVERQPRGCWPPVRLRHVNHWIAQMGRASVLRNRLSRVRLPLQHHDMSRHDTRNESSDQETPSALQGIHVMEGDMRCRAAEVEPDPGPETGRSGIATDASEEYRRLPAR